MPFELRVDFAGLVAFVSNTVDPDDATLWNAVLIDPTMHDTVGMEKHYPLLLIPAENIADEKLPPGMEEYLSVPPSEGKTLIGLLIHGYKVSLQPRQTGLKSHMDLVASLEKATGDTGVGEVGEGVFDTTTGVITSLGACVELEGGELFGSQSLFMEGKTFTFEDDGNTNYNLDYEPALCDQVRLFQFRGDEAMTIKFEPLEYDDGLVRAGGSQELNLEPANGRVSLVVANLPWSSRLDADYHNHHFKHYYDLSSVDVPHADRPIPVEVQGGGQTGKLVFCISGLMYSK